MAGRVIAGLAAADMAVLQRALGLLQSGAGAGAEQALRSLSMAARAHPDALYLRAIAAELQGRRDEARSLYEAALAAAPGNAGIWNSYANLLGAMGDAAGSMVALRKAVAAAPAHVEAWINLALGAARDADWDVAEMAAGRATVLAPKDARAWSALAFLEQQRGQPVAAVAAWRRVLAINPRDLRARHNLATGLRMIGEPEAALAAFEQAMRDGLTAPETGSTRAAVLAELGRFDEAVAQYRAVIAATPGYVEAQDALALLLPQIGRGAEALAGYRQALQRPVDRAVWVAAIGTARAVGDAAAMLEWAAAAEVAHGPHGDWTMARIAALTVMGDAPAAIAAALAADQQSLGVQNHLAHLFLQTGDLARAEACALAATRLAPMAQSPWALLTIIWRLMGDAREAWLADYDRLVMVQDLVVPAGWSDLRGFLDDLAPVLTRMHVTLAAPAEQSLRGGTQTRGRLFDSVDPVVRALRDAVVATVEAAIAGLPRDAGHPFLGRNTGRIALAGSWSVRLKEQGFHVSHVHPEGWMSSALYIGVPAEVAAGTGGALAFGVPEAALGLTLEARRVVVPAAGRLVLFPSYFWHGTTGFESEAERLTVAFDAQPRSRAA